MNNRSLLTILIIVIIGIAAYSFFTMKDNRTVGQKVGDAVDALPNVDKAGRQLEDRTPGQKLGDAVKDTGQKIKDNTDGN